MSEWSLYRLEIAGKWGQTCPGSAQGRLGMPQDISPDVSSPAMMRRKFHLRQLGHRGGRAHYRHDWAPGDLRHRLHGLPQRRRRLISFSRMLRRISATVNGPYEKLSGASNKELHFGVPG
jgi:hypothetical protein